MGDPEAYILTLLLFTFVGMALWWGHSPKDTEDA